MPTFPDWLNPLSYLNTRSVTTGPESISQNPSKALIAALGGAPAASGVSVNPAAVAKIPEVEACIAVISKSVARAPMKLRQRMPDGTWQDALDNPLYELVDSLPNPETTATQFKMDLVRSLLQHGRAYAEIIRRPNGTVQSLWVLDAAKVTVDRDPLLRKRYTYTASNGEKQQWVFDADKPPLLDLSYPSPIHACRDLYGLAIALDTFSSLYFAQGGRFGGILTTEQPKLSEEAIGLLKKQFTAMNHGINNAHGVAVLTGGLKYEKLSADLAEAQLVELRKLVRDQICAIWGVNPAKIGDTSKVTYSNLESADRAFLAETLDPILRLIEESVRRDILTTRQYARMRVVFDREALISTDFQTRITAFATARQNGIYSVNDVRRKLHENEISADEGGNAYHLNSASVPLAGPFPTPATPATSRRSE